MDLFAQDSILWYDENYEVTDEDYEQQILECLQETEYKKNLKYSRESTNIDGSFNKIVKFNRSNNR